MKHNKIKIIANSRSGSLNRAELERCAAYLNGFLPTEIVYCGSLGEAFTAAAQADAELELLPVICGGDGSLNTYLNRSDLKKYFGLLPSGTANVVAQEQGISLNLMGAAKNLLTGAVRELDVGLCNGVRFFFVAGVGFDAEAAHNVSSKLKSRFGQYAYHLSTLLTFLRYKAPKLEVFAEGTDLGVVGEFVLVSNMRRYGGDLFFSPETRDDDGFLEVLVVKKLNLRTILRLLKFARYGGALSEAYFCRIRGRGFSILANQPVRFQLDGEVFEPAKEFVFKVDTERAKLITP
jgi:diacylglycerol kinase (ATP)